MFDNLLRELLDFLIHLAIHGLQGASSIRSVWRQRQEGDLGLRVIAPTDAEFRERERTLLARFRAAVVMKEDLADGYQFRIRGDDEAILATAELIAAERQCCRFLKFEVIASSNIEPVVLRVTGPAGTKGFLEHTIQL